MEFGAQRSFGQFTHHKNNMKYQENSEEEQQVIQDFKIFLEHHEVVYKDMDEIKNMIQNLKGQLTATFLGTEADLTANADLIDAVRDKVGRIVFNGVPTGVEVGHAMHHGGPFPASSNGRYTSVGTGAIKRFARPMAWQNCPQSLLPDALKDGNPLGIWRMVNGEMTKS